MYYAVVYTYEFQFDFGQARPLAALQRDALAAVKDGLKHDEVEMLAGLACHGKYKGNVERDFLSRAKRMLHISVETYPVSINMVDGSTQTVHLILPHELFGALWWEREHVAEQRLIGMDCVNEFWQIAFDSNEPFYANHPMAAEIKASPNSHIPIRLWGDDAPVGRHGRAIRTISWASAATRGEAMKSKHLVWITDPLLVPHEQEDPLFKVLAWSLDILATGKYPGVDHTGKSWHETGDRRRERLAGDDLSPHRHKGVYVQSTGDWKYLNEIYHFPWNQSTEEVCRQCRAVKSQGDLNYANPRLNAPWMDPSNRRTDQEFFEAVQRVSPLCSIVGWSCDTVLDDIMHDDLLGVRLNLVGSAMKDMSDNNFWVAPIGGPWRERMNHQLRFCYRSFKAFCREKQLEHSFPRFKTNMLSLDSLTAWPELKSKAHNCAVLSLFLADQLRIGPHDNRDLPQHFSVLTSTMWGFAAWYLVFSAAEQKLSVSEVNTLSLARSSGLEGYHALSLDASNRGVYMYKMQPKFHKLDESIRRAILSKRNPAWWWTFSDESFVGMLSKLCGSCHKKTLAKRAAQRWLTMFYVELRDA